MRLLGLAIAASLMALPAAAGAASKPPPAPAAPTTLPLIGIADQKPVVFGDPRFRALGLRYARYAVAWDAMSSDWQLAELDDWLSAARAAGVEPLLTFSPSRLPGQRRAWPTPAQFVAQFRLLRARYPWVTQFSTWNEANFCGFGPCREPERVAKWWLALSAECPSCTILAADLLDFPNMTSWAAGFIIAAKRQPKAWGFHNYISANRLSVQRTNELLSVASGKVWITETGGLVARRNASTVKLPEGTANATRVTRFILTRMPALSPRIARIYLYQWNSFSSADSWDSGFIAPDGSERPALGELRRLLGPRVPLAPVAPPPA